MALRNTIQRSLVHEAVNSLHLHPTADEIFEEVSRIHSTISRATVYRNLKVLAEEGKVRRLPVPGGADRYDRISARHYHAQCEQCQRIFDMDMDIIEDLENRIRDDKGFHILGHDIIFRGICSNCAQKN